MNYHGRHALIAQDSAMVEIHSDRKATLAEVSVIAADEVFIGKGSSWRTGGDPYDERKGNLIAITRAVEDLYHQLKIQAGKID